MRKWKQQSNMKHLIVKTKVASTAQTTQTTELLIASSQTIAHSIGSCISTNTNSGNKLYIYIFSIFAWCEIHVICNTAWTCTHDSMTMRSYSYMFNRWQGKKLIECICTTLFFQRAVSVECMCSFLKFGNSQSSSQLCWG